MKPAGDGCPKVTVIPACRGKRSDTRALTSHGRTKELGGAGEEQGQDVGSDLETVPPTLPGLLYEGSASLAVGQKSLLGHHPSTSVLSS